MNPFDAYLTKWASRVDEALERTLPPATAAPAIVNEAMRYTVFAGGKRLRPVLCLLAARAAGGSEDEAMPAAAAVEMVHAFSLIHDDLPAMDDDELRRGKPTSHVVFGEAVAILAGDGLLAHAFGALSALPRREAVPLAVKELADAVGTSGLVGGQVEDVAADPVDDSTPDGWPASCYEERMGIKNQVVRDVERVNRQAILATFLIVSGIALIAL